MNASARARPIIIVTGANAGVGYAICYRLLLQLLRRIPSDSLPQRHVSRFIPVSSSPAESSLSDLTECDGLTLVLACRSASKAEAARNALLTQLDKEVERIWKSKAWNGNDKDVKHAETFRKNVQLVVHRIDLASMECVFSFAREIESKYPYVSHLVCNAGVANFIGYNWPLACKQLLTDFIGAVSAPVYKLQKAGVMSGNGLGFIWQCNVFGHYVLFRLLEPLLSCYQSLSLSPARVLWMSSIEARPNAFDPSDYQLTQTMQPYEASKYQIDLLAGWFEQQQQRRMFKSSGAAVPVRHFLFHPGVVRTNIAVKSLNNIFLDWCMTLSLLLAHFLGSPVQTITPYKAAISAVHLILVALPFVTVAIPTIPSSHCSKNPATSDAKEPSSGPIPLKFGSQVDYCFREYVNATEVQEWGERREQAAELAQRCEELFRFFKKREDARLVSQSLEDFVSRVCTY